MERIFRQYGGVVVLLGSIVLVIWWVQMTQGLVNAQSGADAVAQAQQEPGATDSEQLLGTSVDEGVATELQHLSSLTFDVTDVPILEEASLRPRLDPFTYLGPSPAVTYTTYLVEPGDTPNSIAQSFGLQTPTLLGGNPWLSDESSLLQAGIEIIILPVDGALHEVRRGDTLELLADEFDIPVEDIIGYAPNNLEFPYRLQEGSEILLPGAVRDVFVWTPPTLPSRSSGSGTNAGISAAVAGTGTFIWPVTGRRITQYYHYFHRGIDIGLPEGTPVYASDTGTVVWAAWNNTGYGNLIVIDHGNGYVTFYGHLSGFEVYPGLVVYQGGVIGYTGNTGRSSGPHIHFEVRQNGAQQDPFWPGFLP